MDIAKVDRGVAKVVHICCKFMFPMFHLFFFSDVRCNCVYLDVVYVSFICCKCFICMLHMSALISSVLQVFQTHILNILFVFRRMLEVLHLDVSQVDRVLHMLQYAREAEGTRAVPRAV